MSWFTRSRAPKPSIEEAFRSSIPDDVWAKCDGCDAILYAKELRRNLEVCPKCNHHHRISAPQRLSLLVDRNSFSEIDSNLRSVDFLGFKGKERYRDKLKKEQKKTGLNEAVLTGSARVMNIPVMLAIFDFRFMGGSMGSVVGERLTRMVERGIYTRTPVIIISASGGARMQEGIYSLMQMAKVSAALAKLGNRGIPYISILTDPTTGGVAASFAMLGDVILAEPKALIGFAGQRVIEQTIKQKLPEGFQRAEFLLEHGLVDRIVQRSVLRDEVSLILKNFGFGN